MIAQILRRLLLATTTETSQVPWPAPALANKRTSARVPLILKGHSRTSAGARLSGH